MKKSIIALVALSLIVGSIALARENEPNDDREKVPGPSQIKEFKDIIKRGKDLFGRRRDNSFVLVRPEAAACVKTAIETKDISLKAAITANSNAMTAAIDARTTCQKAAIDKATAAEQREANRACLDTFKKSVKASAETAKTAHKAAWTKYKADLKVCGQLQSTTGSSNIMVEDGQDSL
jgi:hypothetical protein